MKFNYYTNKARLCDSLGRRITTGLFEELQSPGTVTPPAFKLVDWKRRYVEIGDPTGYKAMEELIGDWDHWQMLVDNPIFKAHLDEWNREVNTNIKSEAIAALRQQSKQPTGTTAAKYLAEHGYVKKEKKHKEATEEPSRVMGDMKRLGLVK